MSLGTELKQFLLRGNVMDMAVGIVIGAAFGKVVTSFVNDILMPPIALLLGNTKFDQLKLVLREAVVSGDQVAKEAITWNYGAFIQTAIDFLIVGTAIFFVIKAMNRLSRKKPEAPAAPPAPSKEEQLLTEIRDLLSKD
jgi:large conductance mechanosensitive channel